jgi:hypothetical protein
MADLAGPMNIDDGAPALSAQITGIRDKIGE